MTSPRAEEDRYARFVRSERYRAERADKATVIRALCGEALREAERPADLGSGTGLIKKALELDTGKYFYGFEMDRSFIDWSRGTAVADVRRLPVRDGAFDFLVLNHLYEHVDDQPGLFREAYRVLRGGGRAYVSAGNLLAVMEPHYRLPFLSWLPRPLANGYLRVSRRGRSYDGVRFRTYGALRSMMERAGFRVRDQTERAAKELLGPGRGRGWRPVWHLLARFPAGGRRRLLHALSPQWFFLLEKPERRESEPGAGGEREREVG